jgi:hypothetical protein
VKRKLLYKNRIYLSIGRNTEDPEKAILPTASFVNTNHPVFEEYKHRGFLIAVGWWDFSIKFGLFF